MSTSNLQAAQARIADCLQLDAEGNLVQRRDHLNLAGLGLTDAELSGAFDFPERGLRGISLADLPHLKYLDLTGNALAELPACVAGFTDLVWLGLNFNCLQHVEGVERLAGLQRLYLRGNRLASLPDGMGNLRLLQEVDLGENTFSAPDRGLLRLIEQRENKDLHLNMEGNPGEFCLRAKDGVEAFSQHVRQLLVDGVEVREGKLLLVGEGRMGKSTLLQALLGRPYIPDRKQTHGLKMKPLPMETCKGRVRLNCWDFSGQKELRETHQVFFTEPAIYLVVWNAGQTVDAEDLRQWLWLIKHRTNGKGRALVVATNTYQNPRPLTGEKELRDEFGGEGGVLLAPEFIYVECNETGPEGQRNIAALRARLIEMIETDDSFCQRAIGSWHRAQDDLAALVADERKDPYLPWPEFESFCTSRGVIHDDLRHFAKHQHEVGRMVWVDRGAMAQNVILSPDWLSKALGYIVRARPGDDPAEAAGLMQEGRIHSIWRDPKLPDEEGRPEPAMPEAMFPAFRAFMEEFDMAHVTTQADGVTRYLIPQRLLPNPPRRWDELEADMARAPVTLRRRIDLKGYDGKRGLNRWLLRSFFFRLVVRSHPYLVGREDSARAANWEQGFCIEEAYYGVARVFCQGHHLHLEASGPAPERLWWRIQDAVEGLRAHLKQVTKTEIRAENLVPCRRECQRPIMDQGYFPEEIVVKKHAANPGGSLGCRGLDCYEELAVAELRTGVAQSSRVTHDEKSFGILDAKLNDIRTLLEREHTEGRADRKVAGEDRQRLETGLAQLASRLRDFGACLDEPSRAGPCLFLVVPRDPKFHKDRGKLFGSQFRLHLFCERLLKPVSYLRGTEDCGVFDFEMTNDLWKKLVPYLIAVSRLLATLIPSANLSGIDMTALAQPAKDFQTLAAGAEKVHQFLSAEERDVAEVVLTNNGEVWGHRPGEAQGRSLTWLHDFLKKQCKTDDLATCHQLGLQRTDDKTTNRYLWVHHTQM
ncbi:MAG: COR domain-containing protein [Prosthecobacter sp.]